MTGEQLETGTLFVHKNEKSMQIYSIYTLTKLRKISTIKGIALSDISTSNKSIRKSKIQIQNRKH